MPSERAKENKTLTAPCAGCGKSLSTEMLVGVVIGRGRDAKIASVCQACIDKGWKADSSANVES